VDAIQIMACCAGGVVLGVLTGLIPGLHINNVAAVLLALTPSILAMGMEPMGIALLIGGNAIVHTFLDTIPAILLGVPEESTALTTLPGQRMVLAGRGMEAIRICALGAASALLVACALLPIIAFAIYAAYPLLKDNMTVLLLAIMAMVVVTERPRASGYVTKIERLIPRLQSLVLLAASGAMGWLVLGLGEMMTSPWLVVAGEPLLPLLSGLFGAPWLIASLLGRVQIPLQMDTYWRPRTLDWARGAALAATSGALVGFLPGVSSGVAAAVTGMAMPRQKSREEQDRIWLFSISGVNTANTIYALVALYVIGRPRSGAVVAMEEILGGIDLNNLLLLIAAMVGCGAVGFVLTPWFGKRIISVLERVDYQKFAVVVLIFIAMLSLIICGPLGLGSFVACATLGMLPQLWGVRRVALMGCLLVPVAAWFAGIR